MKVLRFGNDASTYDDGGVCGMPTRPVQIAGTPYCTTDQDSELLGGYSVSEQERGMTALQTAFGRTGLI
jgi:hypothetical protein